jgi:chromosome segregation ATPase
MLTDIVLEEVSLVDSPANEGARIMLFKRDAEPPTGAAKPRKEGDSMTPEELEKKLGDIEAELAKAKQDLADATARAEKAEADLKAEVAKHATPPAQEPIEKRIAELPEDIRAHLQAVESERNTLKKTADDAEAARKVAEAEASKAAFIKQAETDIPSLPGTPEEKGALLQAASGKLSKEEFDALLGMLKAGSAALAAGFSEAGRKVVETDVEKRLDTMAKEIAAKDKISYAAAYTKALQANPELYAEYVAAQ